EGRAASVARRRDQQGEDTGPGGEEQQQERDPAAGRARQDLSEQPPRLVHKREREGEPRAVVDEGQGSRASAAGHELAERDEEQEDGQRGLRPPGDVVLPLPGAEMAV